MVIISFFSHSFYEFHGEERRTNEFMDLAVFQLPGFRYMHFFITTTLFDQIEVQITLIQISFKYSKVGS
jgi:hypothetical protein